MMSADVLWAAVKADLQTMEEVWKMQQPASNAKMFDMLVVLPTAWDFVAAVFSVDKGDDFAKIKDAETKMPGLLLNIFDAKGIAEQFVSHLQDIQALTKTKILFPGVLPFRRTSEKSHKPSRLAWDLVCGVNNHFVKHREELRKKEIYFVQVAGVADLCEEPAYFHTSGRPTKNYVNIVIGLMASAAKLVISGEYDKKGFGGQLG